MAGSSFEKNYSPGTLLLPVAKKVRIYVTTRVEELLSRDIFSEQIFFFANVLYYLSFPQSIHE